MVENPTIYVQDFMILTGSGTVICTIQTENIKISKRPQTAEPENKHHKYSSLFKPFNAIHKICKCKKTTKR